ncbi:MAG: hypothetical protein ACI3XI_01410 [Eubacteriales bacterium]
MKIHTVRKYLTQLPKDPSQNLTAHYKTLSDAVCKSLNIRPINGITLAVVGQDAEYTAQTVSSALKSAGISSATVNFDVSRSPETAVTVNGEQLPSDVISHIMTVIRTVERSLAAKEADFSHPCVYEVFLLGALCACSGMGVSHVIMQINPADISDRIAAILPRPKMVHCNEIFPEEAELVRLVAKKGIEEIISAPQQKDSRKALYDLCNELNCNHAVVARGEIEVGTPGFRGIPFTYRGFSATAGTRLPSMVALSATALVTIRELVKLRVKVTDANALEAIDYRKIPGRGEIISVRPYTLCCRLEHADVQSMDLVISDIKSIVNERERRANLIIDSSSAHESNIIDRIMSEPDLDGKIEKIVTVGDPARAYENIENVMGFSEALDRFPYLKDVKSTDDLVLIACGSAGFLEKNSAVLADAVRDEFTY